MNHDQYIITYLDIINQYYINLCSTIDSNQLVGCLVSGGIDSSIIAVITKKYFPNIKLISFGVSNNQDYSFATILADHLHLPLNFLEVNQNLTNKTKSIVNQLLINNHLNNNITQLSLAIGYYLVFQYIKKNFDINYVFTGQGPDILLAGYNMYKIIPHKKLNDKIKSDINLLEIDKKRDSLMANQWGIKLYNPYLDLSFINFCLNIPPELKLHKDHHQKIIEKYLSRLVADNLQLPSKIINRPKKAFQYSTGIQKLVIKDSHYQDKLKTKDQ